MDYDLGFSKKESRRRFIRYANWLLKIGCPHARLLNAATRTLKQNSYMHVLCRIAAHEWGETEDYAKQVYFKDLANHDIFHISTKDKLTGELVPLVRKSSDLTVSEMRKAISRFRDWAAMHSLYLPDAIIADDGTVTFPTEKDKEAFHQAEIMTSDK